MRFALLIFFVAFYSSLALASSGDRDHQYQRCLKQCETRNSCTPGDVPDNFPLAMRLTRWTCLDDCKYTCMHTMTDFSVESGVPIKQYYGKWPFWRFAGMQEPVSVLFSLLNLLLHIWGRGEVKRSIPDVHPMKHFYLNWSLVSCNAWVWSAVFHARDTPLTEKLDYFSAALTILYSLYFSVIRLFHLYPAQPNARLTSSASSSTPRRTLYYLWSAICIIVYISHIAYLTLLPRFDYTYNIVFNLLLGLSHNFLWLAFALPARMSLFHRFSGQAKTYRPLYASDAAKAVVLTTAATCLELFDFPPWKRMVDAHALWHLATAPLAVIWYDFLIVDALDSGWKGARV